MDDRYVIVRYDISQGDASGDEIATFEDLAAAQRAFEAGRASGVYVDQGSYWSGATAYELLRRSHAGYSAVDGAPDIGPYGLLGPPAIASSEVGGTWSPDPSRCVRWPTRT
jgi:hypothetical protein